MSKLLNAKIGAPIPYIDKRLSDSLYFTATCDISDELLSLFSVCIEKTAHQMEIDGLLELPQNLPYVTCIITDTNTISIKLDDNQQAMVTSIIVYPIHRWTQLTVQGKCLCIVEELCHFFWNIRSEFDVNFKVLEILKHIFPNIKMNNLYNIDEMRKSALIEGKDFTTTF